MQRWSFAGHEHLVTATHLVPQASACSLLLDLAA
jgi:hypothetical protein